MKNLKKTLIELVQKYCLEFPAPTEIGIFANSLKITFAYTNPFSNSKPTKQFFYPLKTLEQKIYCQPISTKLIYDQKKNKVEQQNCFNGISTQGKHQKIIQDDVFGKANQNINGNKWVYIAKVKQEKSKSLFLGGEGKKIHLGDFGETYEQVQKVAIFVWDITKKEIYKIDIDDNIIPACPSFSDAQGSKIIFHAYKRQHFPLGILHCFNRQVSIYQVSYTYNEQQKQQKKKISTTVTKFSSNLQTNIFPKLSPCLTKGLNSYILHGFSNSQKVDNNWEEKHRIQKRFIGYYDTFKSYILVINAKSYLFVQTLQNAKQKIYKIDLENGNIQDFFKGSFQDSYTIYNSVGNMLVGFYTNHFSKSVFYTDAVTNQLNILKPLTQIEGVTLKQYNEPINGYLLESQIINSNFQHNRNQRGLCVIIHGGPHGAAQSNMTLLRFLLLRAGYSILLPNFSGSAGFGQKTLKKVLGKVGTGNCQQIIDLLNKVLKQNSHLSPQKIHVMGGSYGGYMTAFLGSKYHKYFKSAIIMNGVLSLPANLYFTDIPQWNTVQGLNKSLEHLSQEDYVQLYRQSPISQPMKVPTLQFLGAKDRRVPYRQGLLFDALTKQYGTPIKTYVYEESNHSLADSVETSVDIIMKSMMFLQRAVWPQQQEVNKQVIQGIKKQQK